MVWLKGDKPDFLRRRYYSSFCFACCGDRGLRAIPIDHSFSSSFFQEGQGDTDKWDVFQSGLEIQNKEKSKWKQLQENG